MPYLARGNVPHARHINPIVRMTTAAYHVRAAAICRPYVEAVDPKATVASYLSDEPGMIVEVDAVVTNAWDYADDAMMPI
jgi:hypothetical protein